MRSRCRRGVLIRARIQIPRSRGGSAGDISHIDFPRSRGWAWAGWHGHDPRHHDRSYGPVVLTRFRSGRKEEGAEGEGWSTHLYPTGGFGVSTPEP